jgi:hypothetical protein
MKKNLGTIDRTLRVIASIVIGLLLYNDTISGTLGIVFGIVAIALLLTGAISFCPLYALLKISTAKKEPTK